MVESAACPGNDEGFMFLCASASAQTRPCWWAKAHGPSVIHQRLPDYPKAESFHSTGAGAAGRGTDFLPPLNSRPSVGKAPRHRMDL